MSETDTAPLNFEEVEDRLFWLEVPISPIRKVCRSGGCLDWSYRVSPVSA